MRWTLLTGLCLFCLFLVFGVIVVLLSQGRYFFFVIGVLSLRMIHGTVHGFVKHGSNRKGRQQQMTSCK